MSFFSLYILRSFCHLQPTQKKQHSTQEHFRPRADRFEVQLAHGLGYGQIPQRILEIRCGIFHVESANSATCGCSFPSYIFSHLKAQRGLLLVDAPVAVPEPLQPEHWMVTGWLIGFPAS